MADKKQHNENSTDRRPDCVTEIRMGDTTATAADKMMKVLEAETAATPKPPYIA